MQSPRYAGGMLFGAASLFFSVAMASAAALAAPATVSSDEGESPFPDAATFLESKGYAPEDYSVLLTWQEVSRKGPEQMIRGYRLDPVNRKEPFDVYRDAAGNLLTLEQLAQLGVNQKNWDLRPASAGAEVPKSLAKAVAPRPVPKGVALNVPPVEELVLPPIDLEAVLNEDWANDDLFSKGRKRIGAPQVFAEPIQVHNGEANYGQWQTLPDGASLWSLYIYSPDAKGQRVHFTEIELPLGANVVVYSADDSADACGPYDGPSEGGSGLWSATCFGDTVVVECYVPATADKNAVRLTIDSTVHIYENLSDVQWTKAAGTCNLDVTCYPAWSTTALGIALIDYVSGGGAYVCSGSLIVDTDPGTDIPYFLTANHCVDSQTVASTVQFYWLYQTASCDGSAPNLALVPTTTGGADFLASLPTPPAAGNDFALLRMRSDPPVGLTFVGWSTTVPSVGNAITCIHHPSGDYKRISFGSVTGGDTNLIEVVWSEGTTEGGSSGSPLMFSSDQKIIGQLLGGYASCGNPTGEDFYGRFSKTYPIVQNYLDPASLYPTADFIAASYPVSEDGGSVLITVELSEAPGSGNTATIDYATSDDSASAGSDYTTTSGTLSFGATETSKTFSVPILDDTDIEGTETLQVTLSNASGCLAGDTNNPATVTISDDDVSLDPVVDFSQDTYTAVEDWGSIDITVTLDKAPGDGNVAQVDYAVSSGTATGGSDYTPTSGTLTFGATDTSQTFSVSILDDSTEEVTETVVLTLSNPDGCALAGVNNPASLRITDDDYVPRVIDFSQSIYSVSEGGASATITVVLNAVPGPGRTVTVDYATADGTATAGADYTAASGTLIFGASDFQKTFPVSTINDSAVEDTETVALTLSNPSGGVLATKVNHPATLVIQDDDAPVVGFSATTYIVNEGDGSVDITVTLSKAPGTGVTASVDYYSDGGTATPVSDYTAVSDTLTFGPTETSKSFTVSIVDDLAYEGTETIRVHLTNPSFCTLNGDLLLANIVVVDNDEEGSVEGDVNGDGVADAVDVQLCVNAALGFDVGTAQTDQNGDGKTDAIDIQLVINAVLGI